MNTMPKECVKGCDKDASIGTTDETGQRNTSFRPSNEEHRLSQKFLASHSQFQWWARSLALRASEKKTPELN